MNNIIDFIQNIIDVSGNEIVSTNVILSVICVVLCLAVYEFFVYRLVSHRAFYNRQFNINIGVLPFFIATIILCLQSNLVITLGTIGALAIIRFRTAVKDPVDMIYLLWSVHIGITCGCQLYELALITSLVVTIVLYIMERFSFIRNPYILMIHSKDNAEEDIVKLLNDINCQYRIKNRSFTSNGTDYAIELTTKNPKEITNKFSEQKNIERFSLIEYDSGDIV